MKVKYRLKDHVLDMKMHLYGFFKSASFMIPPKRLYSQCALHLQARFLSSFLGSYKITSPSPGGACRLVIPNNIPSLLNARGS